MLFFPDPANRPAALARYLELSAAGRAADAPLLEEALRALLADRAQQAAERLDAEEHTENLLQLLGTILESSDEGILALDTEDHIIRFNSRLVRRLLRRAELWLDSPAVAASQLP
jgi:PAS domain-containing protein